MPDSPSRRAPKRASADARSSLWQRIGRASLLVTAGVLPWFFIPLTSAPAATARTLLATIAATAGLVALLADTVERRRLAYPGSWAGIGALAVVLATALAAACSLVPSLSVFGGLVMADSLLTILVAAAFFLLATAFLTERGDLVRLVAAFVGGAGLASLLAVLAMLGVGALAPYAPATVSELGFVAVLALGFACLAPLSALGTRARVALLVSAACALAALMLMNFPILWAATAVIALFAAAAGFARKAGIALPLGLSLVTLVFVIAGSRLPMPGAAAIELRPSLPVTIAAARHALSGGSDALTGTGPGTFAYAYAQSRPVASNQSSFWNIRFDQGTSFLATVPATTGILGSLAWLALLVGAALLARRAWGSPAAPYALLGTGLAGAGMLLYPASFTQVVLGAIALGALAGIAGERRTLAFSERGGWPLFATFLGLIVVTAGSLAGLYLVGQRYVAAASFARSAPALSAGDLATGVARLERAVALDPGSDAYARSLSQALLLQVRALSTSPEADQRAAQALLARAVETARHATDLNPADPANWGNLGGIFEGLAPFIAGVDAQALAAYDEAALRDPKSPVWPLARARTHAAAAELAARSGADPAPALTAAEAAIADALELKPDFADALFLSARLGFASGNAERALARLLAIRAAHPDDPALAYQSGLLLYQNGRHAEARAELERALSLDERIADARYFLGLSLASLGERDAALAHFRRLRADHPDNAEVPRIIENLESGRDALSGIAE